MKPPFSSVSNIQSRLSGSITKQPSLDPGLPLSAIRLALK
jgi:hypothetical protein